MTLQVLKQKQHPQLFGKFGDSPVIFPTLIYIAFITTGHFLSLGGIRLDGAISPLNELKGLLVLWDHVRQHGDAATDRVCPHRLLQRQATTQCNDN